MASFQIKILCALGLLAVLSACPRARADSPLLTLEGSGGKALTAPQSDRFGFGGAAAVAGYYRMEPWLLGGLRLRAGALAQGAAPSAPGLARPGTGTFETLSAVLRLRP